MKKGEVKQQKKPMQTVAAATANVVKVVSPTTTLEPGRGPKAKAKKDKSNKTVTKSLDIEPNGKALLEPGSKKRKGLETDGSLSGAVKEATRKGKSKKHT